MQKRSSPPQALPPVQAGHALRRRHRVHQTTTRQLEPARIRNLRPDRRRRLHRGGHEAIRSQKRRRRNVHRDQQGDDGHSPQGNHEDGRVHPVRLERLRRDRGGRMDDNVPTGMHKQRKQPPDPNTATTYTIRPGAAQRTQHPHLSTSQDRQDPVQSPTRDTRRPVLGLSPIGVRRRDGAAVSLKATRKGDLIHFLTIFYIIKINMIYIIFNFINYNGVYFFT